MMRSNCRLGGCTAALVLLFSPLVQAQTEDVPPTAHAIQNHNQLDRVAGPNTQVAQVQLGADANSQAARDWRKRRIRSGARELRINIPESDLGDLTRADFELPAIVEPDLDMLISMLKGGQPTTSMLSVGMLLGGQSEAAAYSRCTVTLTKPDTVVTARHCLAHSHGDSFWVYFPYGGIRRVIDTGISFFCNDNDPNCSIEVDDLAIVTLDAPYGILPPARVGSMDNASAPSQEAIIVGFGLSNPDLADYGIKRQGKVQLATCDVFAQDGLSLCFEFLQELVPDQAGGNGVGIHANCNNDSGGPMLTPATAFGERLIGVASQLAGSCDSDGEGRYVNATNARYQDWLKSAFCDPICARPANLVLSDLLAVPIEYLSETVPTREHQIVVQDGTTSLVVTLNHGRGFFPFPNNLNLELPAVLNPTCVQFVEVEVCTVNAPAAGTYNATVTRVDGEAEYQLSAVAFADAADPGSE